MSKQLRYYNKKTDRFRLRNHKVTEDNGSSSNIIIVASQEYSFHLFLGSWNQKKRILDHMKWESQNFVWKLQLKKLIKIQLIQRHEHEHKHGFIS